MRVNDRYAGFPSFALGGYVAGVLAAGAADAGALEVRLHRAVRIGDVLELQPTAMALTRDGEIVATARPVELDLRPPETVGLMAAEAASASYLGLEHHFFAQCFCCGSARHAGDGLRIFPGIVTGSLLAAPWRPADAAGEATVPVELVWSALDCPGIWAEILATTGSGERAVTGSLAVLQLQPVPAHGSAIVLGWPIGRDGRKIYVGAAITTERGEVLAVARQTLIVTDDGVPLDHEVWQTAPHPIPRG